MPDVMKSLPEPMHWIYIFSIKPSIFCASIDNKSIMPYGISNELSAESRHTLHVWYVILGHAGKCSIDWGPIQRCHEYGEG